MVIWKLSAWCAFVTTDSKEEDELSQQWTSPVEPAPRKAKTLLSAWKGMAFFSGIYKESSITTNWRNAKRFATPIYWANNLKMLIFDRKNIVLRSVKTTIIKAYIDFKHTLKSSDVSIHDVIVCQTEFQTSINSFILLSLQDNGFSVALLLSLLLIRPKSLDDYWNHQGTDIFLLYILINFK